MSDHTPTLQFEEEIRAAVAVPPADDEFINNLHTRLVQQASSKAKLNHSVFLRPAWVITFVVVTGLLVSTLLIGPQRVVAAMRSLIGYLPGVGIVDQNEPIRVLAEPVSLTRDGVTVTVKQVVADSVRTFVAYQIDGIPAPAPGSDRPVCVDPPALQLPDGITLRFTSGGGFGMESESGRPMSFETNYTFPPISEQINHLVFLSPCQMPIIELTLIPAPVDYATPVVEIVSTYEASGPETLNIVTPEFPIENNSQAPYPTFLPATPTAVPNGSGLYLDKVFEMEESYLLIGNFSDAGDLSGSLETSPSEYIPRIEDENGKPVQFKTRTDIQPEIHWGGVYYWAYEIPKPVNGPLKIIIDTVNVHKSYTTRFQFDTGLYPQAGQEWQLNQPLKLGGYDYVINWVKMLKNGYQFNWHSGIDVPEGTSYSLLLPGIPASMNEGSTAMEHHMGNKVAYTQDLLVDGTVPTGALTVELTLYQTVPLAGPWILYWTPPIHK